MNKLQTYLTEAGVPAELHAQALASLQSARKPALIRFWLGLTAPIVWLFIAALLPRKAEQLPRWLRWYDNNISLNGDRTDWALIDGRHVRMPAPDEDIVREDGTHLSYWPPHSPRSFLPRWSFNGIRNRCAWLAKKWGRPLESIAYSDGLPVLDGEWGNPEIGRQVMGIRVACAGGVWQLVRTSKLWGGTKTENYGFEVLNANTIDRFATCTWTAWSWKGPKK
ncbi:hypothetical protein WH367_23015 [Comamonas sp. MYb21]|uniref:hypothetical protein n=1 Tax=Comamonas sp. MYb21 TaxID=1848648 RepID=UPI00309999E2